MSDEFTYLVSVAGYSLGGSEYRASAGFGIVVRRGGKGCDWSVHMCHATDYQARRRGEAFIMEQLKIRMSYGPGPGYGQKYPVVWLTSGKAYERAMEMAKRAATHPVEPTYQDVGL